MAARPTVRPRSGIHASLFRNFVWLGASGFAAILVLFLLGYLGLIAAAIGLIIAGSIAVIGTVEQAGERQAIDRWLDAATMEGEPQPLPLIRNPFTEAVGLAMARMRRELSQARTRSDESERLLEALIEALPDPVMMLDRRMELVRANAATARTFEATAKGVPLARILRDPGLLAAVSSALESQTGSQLAFNPAAARDKRFAARVEPIDLGNGEPGVMVSLREQTEQVLIERMRSDFVANASHEIKTPLASLQGFIETLRGPARDDAKARESFLATMAEETARMNRLVDDLLSLSRIELAAHRPPSEICHLGPILDRALDTMRPLAASRGIKLTRDCGEGLPALRADGDQLHQMIVNFLDNAFKYAGGGCAVGLILKELDRAPSTAGPLTGRPCVMISVEDDGPGIPEEHIPRLTERFYRVDTARSRRVGGTGLGLAIVKHILRRHGGHLTITSELGQGSRFTVYLPLPEIGAAETRN